MQITILNVALIAYDCDFLARIPLMQKKKT